MSDWIQDGLGIIRIMVQYKMKIDTVILQMSTVKLS